LNNIIKNGGELGVVLGIFGTGPVKSRGEKA